MHLNTKKRDNFKYLNIFHLVETLYIFVSYCHNILLYPSEYLKDMYK